MQAAIEKHPKKTDSFIQYGTSGFRTRGELLDHVVFRMGLLAALRSRGKNSAAIGLMITASHNPEHDNGIKLIDPLGEMLEMSWEPLATKLANVDDMFLQEELANITMSAGIDVTRPALVFIGRDTRPSSLRLSEAAAAGVKAYEGCFIDHGVVSTPILHYLVHAYNTSTTPEQPLKENYYNKLATAFRALRKEGNSKMFYVPEIDFDGSNGVGALVMKTLIPLLKDSIKVNMRNDDVVTKGKLNYMCGADYVKSNQRPPQGFDIKPEVKIVSVDGDADRVVYSYVDTEGKFHLLDGDRIATLVASYLMDLVKESGLELELGLVQTAYANGSSTKYISQTLNIPVSCVETGVKHLHHKALEYDIGIYFEANGHGTVVFSNNAKNLMTQAINDERLEDTKRRWVTRLKQVSELINSTVGDAISDFLLVETILHAKGWSVRDWEAVYTDRPNKLVKVVVKDRNVIKTTDAARKCTHPDTLQPAIDAIVADYTEARVFVRPSGTEDVVRIYAEAASAEDTERLATRVAKAVYDLAGGIGDFSS